MCLRRHVFVACLLLTVAAGAQPTRNQPQVGFLYPAGGQQGRTVDITVGGQALFGVYDAVVTGDGIEVINVTFEGRDRPLDPDQRQVLGARLRAVGARRRAEMFGDPPPESMDMMMAMELDVDEDSVELPDHPLLNNVDDLSLGELFYLRDHFFDRSKRQLNNQIAERAAITLHIAPDAEPGMRELRLRTPLGYTNPVRFHVSALPEWNETEPNDPVTNPALFVPLPVLDTPVLVNGQIMPGDVDRFRFRATAGQPLAINVSARALKPFLADAVPGWFQATLTVYDAWGRERAFMDDYGFHPDPLFQCTIPEDGEYEIEVRDSIYRGREDFVYRVAIGDPAVLAQSLPDLVTGFELKEPDHVNRPIEEMEPNDRTIEAVDITVPVMVHGTIGKPGDVDWYEFSGKADDEVVVEVVARHGYSPLDSLVRLTNAKDDVIAWNDDNLVKQGHLHRDMGILTHHADSYLSARLPEDGTYRVRISDAQGRGGADFGYQLRISPPEPDVTLYATPSAINVPAGRTVPITVHAVRKDGFDGAIEIELNNAPLGFELGGGRIPSGVDTIQMTLTAPINAGDAPITFQMIGRAWNNGHPLRRDVIPADDTMQAFLWRHLVPAQQFIVAATGKANAPLPIQLADPLPIKLPTNKSAHITLNIPKVPQLDDVRLVLNDPPDGITLEDVKPVRAGLELTLKQDGASPAPGYADNLIIEVFLEPADENGQRSPERRYPLGVLPAIPFEVI